MKGKRAGACSRERKATHSDTAMHLTCDRSGEGAGMGAGGMPDPCEPKRSWDLYLHACMQVVSLSFSCHSAACVATCDISYERCLYFGLQRPDWAVTARQGRPGLGSRLSW